MEEFKGSKKICDAQYNQKSGSHMESCLYVRPQCTIIDNRNLGANKRFYFNILFDFIVILMFLFVVYGTQQQINFNANKVGNTVLNHFEMHLEDVLNYGPTLLFRFSVWLGEGQGDGSEFDIVI